jgi:CRP-like cAMP-binding protein
MDRNGFIHILQQEGNLKHSFSADEIQQLAEHMALEEVPEESILMHKGEPADCMVFIVNGLLQVLMEKTDRTPKPGDSFGESLFSNEATG